MYKKYVYTRNTHVPIIYIVKKKLMQKAEKKQKGTNAVRRNKNTETKKRVTPK